MLKMKYLMLPLLLIVIIPFSDIALQHVEKTVAAKNVDTGTEQDDDEDLLLFAYNLEQTTLMTPTMSTFSDVITAHREQVRQKKSDIANHMRSNTSNNSSIAPQHNR